MNTRLLKPLTKAPKDQSKKKRAEFIKYRIYGGVTILAVNVGLLVKSGVTVNYAYISIITTIIGLWLASIFAEVLSYRIVNDKNMPKADFVHEVTVHRGLLLAAVPSMLMFSLAAFELIAIRTAIIADICLVIIAMTLTILQSSKTKSNSLKTALVSVILQSAAAALIVLVKLGGE